MNATHTGFLFNTFKELKYLSSVVLFPIESSFCQLVNTGESDWRLTKKQSFILWICYLQNICKRLEIISSTFIISHKIFKKFQWRTCHSVGDGWRELHQGSTLGTRSSWPADRTGLLCAAWWIIFFVTIYYLFLKIKKWLLRKKKKKFTLEAKMSPIVQVMRNAVTHFEVIQHNLMSSVWPTW